MAAQVFPTKGNLLATKKALSQAKLGYDLLDKKRSILIMEMMQLMDKAKELNSHVDEAYSAAYQALQRATIRVGTVYHDALAVPIDNSVEIGFHSVMGVSIPSVHADVPLPHPYYGIYTSAAVVDEAYLAFLDVKKYTLLLVEVENSIYHLAKAIQKTQRRANSLKNIAIPSYDSTAKYISNYLEEKDREDFSRLKVIKRTKKEK